MGPDPYDRNCPTRQLLDRIGDQWTVLIVGALKDGPLRFTEIGHRVDGISQKVLTQTLRSLVRDGILTRKVYAVMPPNVTYQLTPLGTALLEAATPLLEWTTGALPLIDAARAEYDARGQ